MRKSVSKIPRSWEVERVLPLFHPQKSSQNTVVCVSAHVALPTVGILQLQTATAGKAEGRLHLDHVRVVLTVNTRNASSCMAESLNHVSKVASRVCILPPDTQFVNSHLFIFSAFVPPLNDFLLAAPRWELGLPFGFD